MQKCCSILPLLMAETPGPTLIFKETKSWYLDQERMLCGKGFLVETGRLQREPDALAWGVNILASFSPHPQSLAA